MPHAEIHYLTKPSFQIVLKDNPYIDTLHLLDKSPAAKARELKKEQFDLVIDLHHNLRTAIFKAILGVEAYSFNKLNIEKYLLVQFKINKLPALHIVDRYMATLEPLGIVNDGAGLDYFIPAEDKIETILGFKPKEQNYFTWAIGAQHFTKRLPAHKIVEFAKSLPHPIVLLGGKEDIKIGSEIAEALGEKCLNFCGQLNLNQSAYLVQQSERLFTNDTGLMHIAAALQIPTTTFWGNTVPEFGMYAYYGNSNTSSTQIENKNLTCRPCSKIGKHACPKGHFKCMEMLGEAGS
ncbi:MAG: glycosyltransferase family 9 protein [Bacteroidia bacterium]|nr:glycosyltransferase family 9 protein [Bacteroidia bacterium]